jgi:hypothetical protein
MKNIKKISLLLVASFLSVGNALADTGYTYPQVGLPDNPGGIAGILTNVLNWLLLVIGVVAVIAFVISGLQYMISAGDEKDMETAKLNLTYSILGIIAALSGYLIVRAVDAMLRGGIF